MLFGRFSSPFMVPSVVVGMMWLVILDPSIGAANYILTSLGLPPSTWLVNPELVIPLIALLDTWQWSPFVALIVLEVFKLCRRNPTRPLISRSIALAGVLAHHAATPEADLVDSRDPTLRGSPALLRPYLYHYSRRARERINNA